MRAVAIDSYGSGPEVRELPDPAVGPDSVLVRVQAASLNPVDYKILDGALDAAWPVVWPLVPGWDVAGVVAGVGPAVRGVEVGQPVVGYARKDLVGTGTWAELVAMPLGSTAPAPATLDPVAASCLPLAGLTAWQSLVEVLRVGPGDTVLVNAASGGVGHLAVQIAVALGARVLGTASPARHDFVRGLGAEPVAYGDGLAEAVRALAPEGVDAVADFAGGEGLEAAPGLLRAPGRLASIVDADGVHRLGGTYVFVRADAQQLSELVALADAGRVVPHVQSVHGLDDVTAAVAEARAGVQGKVVLKVAD